jgi:hypothetical protein
LNGASPLLATRRLADDPKLAFRAVRGLVLAIFLGTIVGALVPTLNSLSSTPDAGALSNVLVDTFAGGLPGSPVGPQAGAALVSGLRAIPGTTVYPLYALPEPESNGTVQFSQGQNIAVVTCAVMRELSVLGQCAPGLTTAQGQRPDAV